MSKRVPVIIIGGGGHAKVVVDALRLNGEKVLGVLDTCDPTSMLPQGLPWLGPDDAIGAYAPDEVMLANGIGSARSTALRKKVFEHFGQMGYHFTKVIHPSAIIAPDVLIGCGSQIMAGAVIQTGAVIGCNTIINTRASVDHDCQIGDHVHIAPGATLSGTVCVSDGAHVGVGAVVIQGIEVGPEALIGAGAVVVGDIPAATIALGVPARVVEE